MLDRELRKNGEGYDDPTAYEAIKNIEYELYRKKKMNALVEQIKRSCDLADFEVEGRIVLRDKKTGTIWR